MANSGCVGSSSEQARPITINNRFEKCAANSGCVVSSSEQARPRVGSSPEQARTITINNCFENCAVNMQQGTENVMETSSAAPQESSGIETESFDSGSSYDVVIQDSTDREFDLPTLSAFGVVGRSEQRLNSSDQCCDHSDDEETYEKQIVDIGDVDGTSPKSVHLPYETSQSLPGCLQSSNSQFNNCCSDGRSQCAVAPGDDACSSSVTVDSRGHAGDNEMNHVAGITAEDAAEEDTARKELGVDLTVHPAAAADDVDGSDNIHSGSDDDGGHDGEQHPDWSVEPQADGAAGSADSRLLESVRDVEAPVQRITEDACNTSNSLNSALSSTNETVFTGELHSDAVMLPASPSVQHESHMNSDVIDYQSSGNSSGSMALLHQRTADRWFWLRSAIHCAAQVSIYIYRYATY